MPTYPRGVAPLWTLICAKHRVGETCRRVTEEIGVSPFRIWVEGEVGAGKTFWVGKFFRHLGLSAEVGVTSPTYTYACEYEIAGRRYNHCDLYRVETLAQYHGLGIDIGRYHGGVYEWATTTNCDDLPSHLLKIAFAPRGDTRVYRWYRCVGGG